MKIITIGREFGSGGRELAKRLAKELDFKYYDKEIISEIAKSTDLDEDYVNKVFEKGLTSYPLHFGTSFAGLSLLNQNSIDIMIAHEKIIRELAQKGDCVFVGRSADAILNDLNPLNIFVYADTDYKLNRCKKYGEIDAEMKDKEILKRMKQIDNGRAKTHSMFASNAWGDRQSYHLLVNTTGFEDIDDLVPSIAEFAEAWFDNNEKED